MVSVILKSYCMENKLLILEKQVDHYASEIWGILPKQNIRKGQAFQTAQVFIFLYLFHVGFWCKYSPS